MKFKLLILTAIFVFTVSCSSKTDVTGEVFVLTEDAGNQKLALVQIYIYTEKEINAHLAKMANDDEVASLKAEYEQAKAYKGRQSQKNEPGLYSAAWGKQFEVAKELIKAAGYERIFTSLPTPTLTAQTDPEGKFSFSIPKEGRYAIAAKGTRKFVYDEDHYYWLLWVNADGTPKKIILNNSNMPDAGSLDSVISENRAIIGPVRQDLHEMGSWRY
jgi:hypothetical protein